MPRDTIPPGQTTAVLGGTMSREWWEAVRRGDVATVREQLSKQSTKPNEMELRGALIVACGAGHVDLAEFLLVSGASAATMPGRHSAAVLAMMSVAEGRTPGRVTDLLDLLFRAQPAGFFSDRDVRGNNVLHWAARLGMPYPVWMWLLRTACAPADALFATNDRRRTPLHVACLWRRPPGVAAILEMVPSRPTLTAIVEARDCSNRTPLQCLLAVPRDKQLDRTGQVTRSPSHVEGTLDEKSESAMGIVKARGTPSTVESVLYEKMVIAKQPRGKIEAAAACSELLLGVPRANEATLAAELNEPLSSSGESVLHRAQLERAPATFLATLTGAGALFRPATLPAGRGGATPADVHDLLCLRLDRLTEMERKARVALHRVDDMLRRFDDLGRRLATAEQSIAAIERRTAVEDAHDWMPRLRHESPPRSPLAAGRATIDSDENLAPLASIFLGALG